MNDLILSPIISSGMIMQRDVPFPVHSSKKVTIAFLGKKYEAQKKENNWLITLDPVKAGGPFEMEISFDDGSLKIDDIYSGDVWLCAGQSNMELQMQRLRDNFGEEWEELAEDREQRTENNIPLPLIRHFKVPQEYDFDSPRENIKGGKWVAASFDTLHEFSGTGWFFAKELYKKYSIPIGLINTAWGGTPIESWMSEEALISYSEKTAEAKQFADTKKIEEISNNALNAINEWETLLNSEDSGLINHWEKPETDISGWKEITMPENFANSSSRDSDLNNFCGTIWLAKDFTASKELAGASHNANVWLGTIVDADTVYINGKETGNTTYRYPPRKYNSGGSIKEGLNRIVIRVTCTGSEGGITKNKPFRIFTDNASVELEGAWKYKIGAFAPSRPCEYFFSRHPIGNYNAMIYPVLKFPIKGVIWYQGESNGANVHEYSDLFKKMILDWRKKNGKDFPFLFVQLPVFGSMSDNSVDFNWPLIREAQASALDLPFTAMAAALDLGEWNDLHPLNKKDIGIRLFHAAEKLINGVNNTSPGPVIREQKTEIKDNKIYLYFDNCGDGLTVKAPALSLCAPVSLHEENSDIPYISIFGEEGQFNLPAVIEGRDVISIDISTVKNPKKILYAWADNPRDRQLYNSEGLPMLPFRINI